MKSGIGWIHGLLYRKQFLIEKSLYFSTNTIQQEDRDFNFKLFQESPNYLYVSKAAYIYYYRMNTTIERWKKNPDGMIDAGTIRFDDNIKYIDKFGFTDIDTIKEKLIQKRIEAIYSNAVDLYLAKKMSNTYKQKLTDLMKALSIPKISDKKIITKYSRIIHQKWNVIRIYAKLRLLYLKAAGIW